MTFATANGPAVIVAGLTKAYGERVVIDKLNLRIERGEFVALLGESGCGKTTLLRALAGLDPVQSGRIDAPGRPAVVFQEHRLLPWDTLWENVSLGLPGPDVRERAAATEKPADDPILQQTIGQISSNAFVAEAAVLAAAEALDVAGAAWDVDPADTKPALDAALAAAKAKIVIDELAIRGGSLLFDAGGASATRKSDNLDRHWRNARTLSSHNPITYKAQAIGDYEVNGTPLPSKGFF